MRSDIPFTIQMDAVSHMQNAGRFALPAQSTLVINFFNSDLLAPQGEYKEYSVLEIQKLVGGTQKFDFSAYNYQDGVDDFGHRAYLWGSQSFKINDDAVFIVEADGSRHINNLTVRPFDENFDFESDDGLTAIGDIILKDQLDPMNVGKTVWITFTDESKNALPKLDYSFNDLQQDLAYLYASFNPVEGIARLPLTMYDIVNQLKAVGPSPYMDGRVVKYGTNSGESLVANDVGAIEQSTHNLNGGSLLYAGEGDDYITGSSYSDYLNGGFGRDEIQGGAGDDIIYGGPLLWWRTGEEPEDDDKVNGGDGDDQLRGGDGDDQLSGGDGDDIIYGDHGNDYLIGGQGRNELIGGIGNDIYIVSGEHNTIYDEDELQIFYQGNLLGTIAHQLSPGSEIYMGEDGNKYTVNYSGIQVNNDLSLSHVKPWLAGLTFINVDGTFNYGSYVIDNSSSSESAQAELTGVAPFGAWM